MSGHAEGSARPGRCTGGAREGSTSGGEAEDDETGTGRGNRRSGRGRNAELLRDAVGAPALDQDQQPAGAADAEDLRTNACGGYLPGRQGGTDARSSLAYDTLLPPGGDETLSADEPAGRSRGHRLSK
jgi:hypothetical protein